MSTTRKWVLVVIALLVMGGGVGYFVWLRPFLALANVGIGYVAKQMCSCIYVAERSYDSCRPDILESMDDIRAELMEDPPGVRAFVDNFGERHALYRGELGCTLID